VHPNPANRLLELLALALDLFDLPLELLRHAVELAAELSELVVFLDRHRLREVAAAEPPRGGEGLRDLLLEAPGRRRPPTRAPAAERPRGGRR
jgi:hypothetical protein